MNGDISVLAVSASLLLIFLAIGISRRDELGLEGSIAWAALRAAVQLSLVGLGLGLVLSDNAPVVWSWLWVAGMVLVGAITVARRVPTLAGLFTLTCAALSVAVVISLGVVFLFGIFPMQPRTIVPVAGMLLGNAIGSTVLAARRTLMEIDEHRDQIEVRLSLGQTGATAMRLHVREALRTAVTPQIEQTKIVGLVALPGTMTGLLLAGVSAKDAVLVQLAVMFLILGSVAITSVIVGRGVARRLVSFDQRLVLPTPPA